MTTSAGLPDGPRRDGLVHALDTLRSIARASADEILGSLPDTGDLTTGRAVDDFVEQAGDALRALDEVVSATLLRLGAPSGSALDHPGETAGPLGGPAAYRPRRRDRP